MRNLLYLVPLVLLIGCSRTDDRPAATPPAVHVASVQEVAAGYTKLKSMTKEPVYVDARLASLCRGASQEEVEAARKKFGPHAHAAISIYMNDLAADAFAGSIKPFPVGSIIVKEKKALS